MPFFRAYANLLKRRPFSANMATTGMFFGGGDLLAQTIFPTPDENGDTGYHYPRTVRAMIYGSCFFAPISVIWHQRTLPKITNIFVGTRMREQLAKSHPQRLHFLDVIFRVSVDQLFITSLVWIPMYNLVMVTLAGHPNPVSLAWSKLETNWWTVLKASWCVWPAFQYVNLFFIPVHLRIVAGNMWSVMWTSFLSYIHNTPGHGKGSGRRFEELVDIQDASEEITMVYD